MPLTIRLRAGEQAFVNGAMLTNPGPRTISFNVDDKAIVLRRRETITLEQANTPLKRAYFYAQLMYLDGDNLETHRASFLKYAQAAFFTLQDDDQRNRLFLTSGLASAGDTLAVLRELRALCREAQPDIEAPDAEGGPNSESS